MTYTPRYKTRCSRTSPLSLVSASNVVLNANADDDSALAPVSRCDSGEMRLGLHAMVEESRVYRNASKRATYAKWLIAEWKKKAEGQERDWQARGVTMFRAIN